MLATGSGSLAAPLIHFAAVLLVTQFYAPEAYGLWAVLMSIVLIPGAVATLRYELAIVLAESEQEAGSLFLLAILLSAATAALTWVTTFLAVNFVQSWSCAGGLVPWLWTVAPLVFLAGFTLACDGWCTRQRAFGVRALCLVLLAALVGAVQVGAYLAGFTGVGGLILGTFAGYSASSLLLLACVWGRSAPEFVRGFRLKGLGPVARKHRNFPLFSVPYTFVGTLRLQGVTLLFGALAGGAAVGLYSLAYRLTNFPVSLFTNCIRPVLFEKAARERVISDVQPFLENLLHVVSSLCLPGLVLFLARAEVLFEVMLPENWLGIAPYARILVVPAVAFVLTNWMDRILDVLRLQRLAFQLEVAFSTASLVAILIGLLALKDPLLAAGLQSTCLLAYSVWYIHVVYREARFSRRGLWQYARFVGVLTVACAGGFILLDSVLPLLAADLVYLAFAYAGVTGYLARRFATVLGAGRGEREHPAVQIDVPRTAGVGGSS